MVENSRRKGKQGPAANGMHVVPATSETLLRDVAGDAQHVRWGEFVARYRPMMAAYLRERFPSLDADDVIQETLLALVKALPSFRYVPDEKGAFHNYLTGILRHKAIRLVARASRRAARQTVYANDPTCEATAEARASWREAMFEVALQQYLADETVSARTRQVFARVAVNGEKPEAVAAAFGIARNAVDQIKSRAMARLRALVKALERAGHADGDL